MQGGVTSQSLMDPEFKVQGKSSQTVCLSAPRAGLTLPIENAAKHKGTELCVPE